MYVIEDTIVAISSPRPNQKVIIRITGPDTVKSLQKLCSRKIDENTAGIQHIKIEIENEIKINAILYLFIAPQTYTGQTLAEIHIHTNETVAEAIMEKLLAEGLRLAEPGEFTARSYLNGKIDLTQAEAVNEIIISSNKLQLQAAEKLLDGRLTETTQKICLEIIKSLSLIEAGIDFSQENIEFADRDELIKKLSMEKTSLQQLLDGSISFESIVDLPSVGIAGCSNAGKSSLLNKLLERERSIVSSMVKTTRDILTEKFSLTNNDCILFDCAGLVTEKQTILDELAQLAALEAINNASIIILCVDISKKDFHLEIDVYKMIQPRTNQTSRIFTANKSDLLSEQQAFEKIEHLKKLFGSEFIPISTKTGCGLETLKKKIDDKISELFIPAASQAQANKIALNARHKQTVAKAIEAITETIEEIKEKRDEVAAMLLRSACLELSDISQQPIDEQILENIFSNFCIGK